jgi:hypothetical protein
MGKPQMENEIAAMTEKQLWHIWNRMPFSSPENTRTIVYAREELKRRYAEKGVLIFS